MDTRFAENGPSIWKNLRSLLLRTPLIRGKVESQNVVVLCIYLGTNMNNVGLGLGLQME